MYRCLALAALVLLTQPAVAARDPSPPQPPPSAPVSSTAEGIYDAARPRLLQVRTLLSSADRQTSLGSAFLVSADGLAITNYHVVSQYALEPGSYRLDYVAADGRKGNLTLMAVDVADDLAVVRLDKPGPSFFSFDPRAIDNSLPQGERLYALGNPLDLGFSIVEGTYNGLVDRSYQERQHFSGAINPGMSGGPVLAADGSVAGVNVAKNRAGELVSFMVPGRFAAQLLKRATGIEPPAPPSFHAEIEKQLVAWQAGLYHKIAEAGFKPATDGDYQVPESAAPWFTCWAHTNRDEQPKPRATDDTTSCASDTNLFVAEDLTVGSVTIAHAHMSSDSLNALQFATFAGQHANPAWMGNVAPRWQARTECTENFVQPEPAASHPPLRLVWCARAYRRFAGIYDVSIQAMTQDRDREAVIAHATFSAIAYDDALALGKSFVDAIRWSK